MIVLDASAALEFLLRSERGERIADRIAPASETLHAPHLIDVEVARVVGRLVRTGDMDATRGAEALSDLRALDLVRYPHDILLERMWELRDNCTAYDSAYVALAEALAAPLLTTDATLAAIPALSIRFEVL